MNGINGIGGINTSLYLGADAMQTHTIGMQVCAHDVANISTANFLPQREIYATGPSGMGVDLDAVIRDPMPPGGGELARTERLFPMKIQIPQVFHRK